MANFLKYLAVPLVMVAVLIAVEALLLNTHDPEAKQLISSQDEVLKVVIAGSPHETDYLPFDWKTYNDPSRPEFWADGEDGIMPRPFLHLASEPTLENAKQLLSWKKKQWEVVEEIIKALGGAAELDLYKEILGKSIIDIAAEMDPIYKLASARVGSEAKEEAENESVDWSSLQVIYIYRSSCPHCKSSASFIDSLGLLGAKVTPLQTDHKSEQPLHANSLAYTKELKEYFPLEKGEPTPTFFFRYKTKEPFSHVGKLSLSSLTSHLKGTSANKKKEI